MKNILKLNGVQKLSKKQKKEIKGAFRRASCCNGSTNKCRISFSVDGSICIPGYCQSNSNCMIA